jgi:hypothetical protein
MIINSKNYFNENIKVIKTYKINVVNNNLDQDNMINYFKYFINLKNRYKIVCLDFEFNSSPTGKKIALFQINLESDLNDAMIYLFYPPDLNTKQLDILIKLLTDEDIKKVLHGAESLDIPYLFKNIFITHKLRTSFCNNLFDTRYLCEYYHLENNIDNKCKIYSILREMKVINDIQLNMLIKNDEEMGPIYLIDIDVNKLNEEKFKNTMLYCVFDVLYLARLLEKFPNKDTYTKLIPELTCFNYIDKYENIFTTPFSELVGRVNNFYLKRDNGSHVKLINIYEMYYNVVDDKDKILSKLMKINYFKKFIGTFIKFVIYKTILKKYIIWENNKNVTNILKEFIRLEKQFSKINLSKYFEQFFKEIRSILKDNIA